MGLLQLIGNILWILLGGILLAIGWFLAGVILLITIIGIPFGIQCIKIAGFVLWPFGREVKVGDMKGGQAIGNIIWILLFGWELALGHLIVGIIFAITIIGIPFGKQHFKLMRLAFVPFGSKIKG